MAPQSSSSRPLSGSAGTRRGKKRKVGDEDLDPARSAYTPGDVWLNNGNVMLVAENTAFKVYRGILCQHSKTFEKLLSSPPAEDVKPIDGCTVYCLDDSAQDLQRVLSALFSKTASSYFSDSKILSFIELSSMLRPGHKYQIENIRDEAIRRLENCLADTLDDYISYDTLSNRTLVLGHTDEDGTQWKLSSADLERCLEGQRRLRRALLRSYQGALSNLSRKTYYSGCAAAMVKDLKNIWDNFADSHDALVDSGRLMDDGGGHCSQCMAEVRREYDRERRRTWDRLAEYFDLDED
ncbi:hypothetical protein EIP91_007822 [Steccherinum ochraceum]|uniref:BTB domain-containing protein n=1 Tax=Steccherinum ochraceum TaxID=92696 RepID=A0A4R0R6E3_9APHY|nr:hypothetical protein EIP91_007822 [Steccherinum ochraceum]